MEDESLVVTKIKGAMCSLELALKNYNEGNKLAAKGDLDYAVDKTREAIFLILAEVEEENDGKIYK